MIRSGFCILLQGLIVQYCNLKEIECHVIDPKSKGLLFPKLGVVVPKKTATARKAQY
jgi:hypothetical protein